MYRLLISIVLLLSFASTGYAELDEIKKKLNQAIPSLPAEIKVRKTPFEGLYEVVSQADVFYTNKNADFILQGTLHDVHHNKNLTEESQKHARHEIIATIPEKRFIDFGDPKARHEIIVMTDVNCGYCRKLHEQRAQYAKLGIKVRYLLTPVLGADSFEKAVSVACAKDPQKSLTRAKMGIPIPTVQCNSEINENLALMQLFGVRGTPAIFLEDGTLVRGYVEPENLMQQIKLSEKDSRKETRAE